MSTIEEIEVAVRQLPVDDQIELARRLRDLLWETWDHQIEEDAKSGRLDPHIAEVESDIAAGRTEPLNEVLDDSQVP